MVDDPRAARAELERTQVQLRELKERVEMPLEAVAVEVKTRVDALEEELSALKLQLDEMLPRIEQERVASMQRKLALSERDERALMRAAGRLLGVLGLVTVCSFAAVTLMPRATWGWGVALSVVATIGLARTSFALGRAFRSVVDTSSSR